MSARDVSGASGDSEGQEQALQLAGADLQPPYFHPVDWKPGQKFTLKDDPDRCLQPWHGVEFFRSVDPKQRSRETTARELRLRPGAGAATRGSFARVVGGILAESECAALLASINKKGFTPALLNTGRGNQQLVPTIRLGFRAIVDSPELAAWL